MNGKLTVGEIKVLNFLSINGHGYNLADIGGGCYPDKITNAQGFALMVCRPVASLLRKKMIEDWPTEHQSRYSISELGMRELANWRQS